MTQFDRSMCKVHDSASGRVEATVETASAPAPKALFALNVVESLTRKRDRFYDCCAKSSRRVRQWDQLRENKTRREKQTGHYVQDADLN